MDVVILVNYITFRMAYACKSERTDVEVLDDLCEHLGYKSCIFTATDRNGTNVLKLFIVNIKQG